MNLYTDFANQDFFLLSKATSHKVKEPYGARGNILLRKHTDNSKPRQHPHSFAGYKLTPTQRVRPYLSI